MISFLKFLLDAESALFFILKVNHATSRLTCFTVDLQKKTVGNCKRKQKYPTGYSLYNYPFRLSVFPSSPTVLND